MNFYLPQSYTLKQAEKRITKIFNQLSDALQSHDLQKDPLLQGFRNIYRTGGIYGHDNGKRTLDFRISLATPYEAILPQIFKRHNTHLITKDFVSQNKAFQNFMDVADKKGLSPKLIDLEHLDKILISLDGKKNFLYTQAHIRFALPSA